MCEAVLHWKTYKCVGCGKLALYPGLLTQVFVAYSTNDGVRRPGYEASSKQYTFLNAQRCC